MKFDVLNYTTGKRQIFTYDNPFVGDYGEAFEKFHHYYRPDLIAPHPNSKMKLASNAPKFCRFCFRTSEQVSFKKVAHVLPQLIGNKYLIHDCECDECNLLLGKYDDSLGKFIGMMRTADGIRGQDGIPTYKSVDNKLILRYEIENNQPYISIYHNDPEAKNADYPSTILLTGIKQPYVPLHVMKSFYKIGYSLLDRMTLNDFSATLQILMSAVQDEQLKQMAFAFKFTISSPFATPLVVTYLKKEEHAALNIPSKVVFLYFGRFIYEYVLPNTNDNFMYKAGEDYQIIFSPPYFNGPQSDLKVTKIDFSSTLQRKGELDEAVFTFDPTLNPKE